MSRIGAKAITLPKGVSVSVQKSILTVKGVKGELRRPIPVGIGTKIDGGVLHITRSSDERTQKSCHGLFRALVANMIRGVTDGFARKLEINGVGYRAEVVGTKINLVVGLSHPVEFELPNGVLAKVEKGKSTVNIGQDAVLLTVSGIDKESVGQLVARVRSVRPPEPYKGKGIKYSFEKIRRKAGKSGKK